MSYLAALVTSADWGVRGQSAAPQKGIWRISLIASWISVSIVPWQPKGTSVPWGTSGPTVATGKEDSCLALLYALWPHLECWVQVVVSQYKNMKLLKRAIKMVKDLESKRYEKQLRFLGLFRTEKWRPCSNLQLPVEWLLEVTWNLDLCWRYGFIHTSRKGTKA